MKESYSAHCTRGINENKKGIRSLDKPQKEQESKKREEGQKEG